MIHRVAFLSCLIVLVGAAQAPPLTAAQKSCESLITLALTNTTITSATSVAAGAFKPPAGPGQPAPTEPLPAFCRVAGIVRPTAIRHYWIASPPRCRSSEVDERSPITQLTGQIAQIGGDDVRLW